MAEVTPNCQEHRACDAVGWSNSPRKVLEVVSCELEIWVVPLGLIRTVLDAIRPGNCYISAVSHHVEWLVDSQEDNPLSRQQFVQSPIHIPV